jgi:hypothetical protein
VPSRQNCCSVDQGARYTPTGRTLGRFGAERGRGAFGHLKRSRISSCAATRTRACASVLSPQANPASRTTCGADHAQPRANIPQCQTPEVCGLCAAQHTPCPRPPPPNLKVRSGLTGLVGGPSRTRSGGFPRRHTERPSGYSSSASEDSPHRPTRPRAVDRSRQRRARVRRHRPYQERQSPRAPAPRRMSANIVTGGAYPRGRNRPRFWGGGHAVVPNLLDTYSFRRGAARGGPFSRQKWIEKLRLRPTRRAVP